MAAFTKKQLRAIVITAIADNLYGRCNYLGLWIFLSVGSDSYSLYWLPREMKSEKLAQKFHTDDATVAVGLIGYKFASTNQKHYPDLGSDASSVWNFCAPFSDVISLGTGAGGITYRGWMFLSLIFSSPERTGKRTK